MYINQGRFGAFVEGFLKAENERRRKEAEKETDLKLWIAYVHTESKEPYGEWKKRVCKTDTRRAQTGGGDENLGESEIVSIIDKLFPGKVKKIGGEQ